jgi:hypothetical protein
MITLKIISLILGAGLFAVVSTDFGVQCLMAVASYLS